MHPHILVHWHVHAKQTCVVVCIGDLPGPGDYTAPSPQRGPAYSLRGRPDDSAPEDSPGPGDYHHASPGTGPAFSMAGRHQELTVLGDDVVIDEDIPGEECAHTHTQTQRDR